MHIERNPFCAQRAIGSPWPMPDNVHMAQKHYLREWREHQNKTLVAVAEHLHMTHGTLSRIERGKVPYNQKLLEALADLYMCTPADLIMRDPTDPDAIWSIWDNAKPGDRKRIVSVARAIVDDGDEEAA